MTDACREVISKLWPTEPADAELPDASNAALVRDRYLKVPKDGEKNHPDNRKGLFGTMCRAQEKVQSVYREAFNRYASSLAGAQKGEFKTKGRLILGLGNENVLETGITLHHTYGTPFIPGTALKGLASHYCDRVWGAKGADFKEFKKGGEYHMAIFGTSDDSGHFTFHDAWITPGSLNNRQGMVPDVMTPHHGSYYSGDDAPTDFDDPNPVTFLSVAGTFYIAVSCDVPGKDGENWTELVFKLLSDALKEWGIGGKTAAGYGRLVQNGKPVQAGDAPVPAASGPRHRKGETITVTRARDPNPKKNRPYFIADDDIGGFIEKGDRDSVDIKIGESYELMVFSFLDGDNRYSFAIPGLWNPDQHVNNGRGGWRR